MKPLLLIVALLVLGIAPASAEWKNIGKSSWGDVYHLDFDTRQFNGNLVRIWNMTNYNPSNPGGLPAIEAGVLSSKIFMEYNCKDQSFRWLQFYEYSEPNGMGKVLNEGGATSKRQYPAPGSMEHYRMTVACKQ